MEPTVVRMTVDKSKAEGFLAKNTRNRGISRREVETFARALERGEWEFNGESLKFGTDGTLLDGQGRCLAVVKTGIPMDTLVITGLPLDAQETMDTGRKRRFSDMLNMRGETHATNLAAATRMLLIYTREGRIEGAGTRLSPSSQELFEVLAAHPGLRPSVAFIHNRKKVNLIPDSAASMLHYLFSTTTGEEDADRFWMTVWDGQDLAEGDPLFVLRARLIDVATRASGRLRTTPQRTAWSIKAWNAWQRGDSLKTVVWRAGGSRPEPFPLVEDCPLNLWPSPKAVARAGT